MAKPATKPTASICLVLILALALAAFPAQGVEAAGPFMVNTTSDSHDALINGICADGRGFCSLRAAIEEANQSAAATTINVPAATYVLTLGELSVAPDGNRTITISGAGAASTIIRQGDGQNRVFSIDFNAMGNTTVAISGVTITGGSDSIDHWGGAGILAGSIYSIPRDRLTLSNCAITDNHVFQFIPTYNLQPGGGLQMAGGDLTVTNCTFTNNTSGASQGGALAYIAPEVGGTVVISDSTFTSNSLVNNTASGPVGGGAIYINSQHAAPNTVAITNSTFQNNSVSGTSSGTTFGGAILINTGVVTIDHSVFIGNTASGPGGQGGAIYVDSGTLNLSFSRLKGNTAPGGGSGVYNHSSNGAITNATNNWWSCNGGPAAAGCDQAAADGANLTVSPWIILTNTASPNPIYVNQSTTLTASFLRNSAGQPLTPANISLLLGQPVSWGNAVLGSLSGQQTTIQSSGTATATFTAGVVGGAGRADATVDNGVATANFTIIPVADLAVTKTAAGSVLAGTNLTYTVSVTNSGPSAASATLSDVLPAGTSYVSQSQTGGTSLFTLAHTGNTISNTIASFPAGATATFEIVARVSPGQSNGSSLSNTASVVSSVVFDPDTTNNSATATTTVSTSADLSLVKSGPSSVYPGAALSYTLTLTNQGPSDAQSVSLEDPLPAGITFLSQAQTSGPAFTLANTGSAIHNTIATLPAGATATFTVSTTVGSALAGGTVLTNAAAVTTSTSDPTPGNNSSSVGVTVYIHLAITSANSATFTARAPGSFTMTAAGYPIPALTEMGAMPVGITFTDQLDGTATLAGTPAAGSGGSYPLTLRAANGAETDVTQPFTLTVVEGPVITSSNAATFPIGAAGSFTVTARGFPAPALQLSGALPSGVVFTDLGNGSASLAGTPPAGSGGVYLLQITAHNTSGPDAVQAFSLHVVQAPSITSADHVDFTVNTPGLFTVTTGGSPAPALALSGSLPAGVTFTDNGNGSASLSGTPALGTVGVYPITITAHNGVTPDAQQSFRLAVQKAISVITIGAAPNPSVYGQAVTFTAGVASSAGTPSGSVQFSLNGANLGSPVSLSGGSAALTMSSLNVGNFTISAAYPGDANFLPAAANPPVSQVVNQAGTTTVLTPVPSADFFMRNLTLTALVAPLAPGAGVPSGMVTFMDGAAVLGTVALDAGGSASLLISEAARGYHSFTAAYSGSAGYAASSQAKLTLVPYVTLLINVYK